MQPGPEILPISVDILSASFRQKTIVGRYNDCAVFLSQVENPLGEPVKEERVSSDLTFELE